MKVNINSLEPRFNYQFETPDTGLIAVYGLSGSGKSSLVNALAGYNTETNGEVLFHKNNILKPNHQQKIGYMPQEPILFPHWDVKQNLNFALNYTSNTWLDLKPLLEEFDCTKLLEKSIHQLSGGEKQRVCLIRTLISATNGTLILLDEPFSALDLAMRDKALLILEKYKQSNLIFLISHKLSELYQLSDQFLYIRNNQVQHNYSTKHIMQMGLQELPIASKVLLAGKEELIYAENVSISLTKLEKSSLVYQLSSTIKSIKSYKDTIMLCLETDSGLTLYSKITLQSFNKLKLSLNLKVYANFKSPNIL